MSNDDENVSRPTKTMSEVNSPELKRYDVYAIWAQSVIQFLQIALGDLGKPHRKVEVSDNIV